MNPLQFFVKSPAPKKKAKKTKNTPGKDQDVEPEIGVIRLKNSKPKYQITDISGKISERSNVTLEIGWNVQPWVGALTWTFGKGKAFGRWNGVKGGRSKTFALPVLKGKSANSETVVSSGASPVAAEASAVI